MRPLVLNLATVVLIYTAGCTSLTPEEAEYQNAENALKWERCKEIYHAANRPIFIDHHHQKGRNHRPYEVESDLMTNHCHTILKGVWN